jgi:SAM-dependent methyltransferase
MSEVKQEVRQFYDQVGWKLVGDEVYQNARYEDLRPVARSYIHDCHLRVARHLSPTGRYLLDAGSGPVQYPQYLEYSRGYDFRVCADISISALTEARRRVGEHALYVVADIANLPFREGAFDGVVSLHTIHHLPEDEHLHAFGELYRVLLPGRSAVVVNGWDRSRLMDLADPFIRVANWLRHVFDRLGGRKTAEIDGEPARRRDPSKSKKAFKLETHKGTFTEKHDATWVKEAVGASMPVEIGVWRSVTVRFMRALIHPRLGGRLWLKLLFSLEERSPRFFGENGKYPLIVIRKPQEAKNTE